MIILFCLLVLYDFHNLIHCALKGWKYIGLGRLCYLGIIIGVPEHQEFCWRTLFPDQVATTLQTCNLFRPSAL